jgi:hypothetical protein
MKENIIEDRLREDEAIISPAHYVEGRRYEPKDVIRDWDLNFNLGNAVKYIARNGRKDGESAVKDLRKAVTYINFEIDYLEGNNESKEVEDE